MKSTLFVAASWLLVVSAPCSLLSAQDVPSGALSANCVDLPFGSFPPNQLLRQDNADGSALRVLQDGKPGTWGEFYIQVVRPGTYRVDVHLDKGTTRGVFQLLVDGNPVGDPVDCYAPGAESPAAIPVGMTTFLKAGNYSFRFKITGKNTAATGSSLALRRVVLTPSAGFTLLSPNGSCQPEGKTLLRWKAWPQAQQYRVEIDGKTVTTTDASATTWPAADLTAGSHHWRVVAVVADGKLLPSDVFSFRVGDPAPYPCREFSDDLATTQDWTLFAMQPGLAGTNAGLTATGPGSAVNNTVRLDKTEGEIAVRINPGGADSVDGVGFQADDGTQLYAVADLPRHQLRLERKLQGANRYSIFDVTPKPYQMATWAERTEGDSTIWEIAAKPIAVSPGAAYILKLAYSRRSGCIMATLAPADGSAATTLRGLTDLRAPDHPLLVSLAGPAGFGQASLRLLNKLVYKWDPDTTRVVLRPGDPGSWDAKGAYNPAIVVHNGVWSMVYRGNAQPAPPNGPIGSELGLATSTDGVHWVRSPANPIVSKHNRKGAAEDPDLIWPKGSTQVCLEYVSFNLDLPTVNSDKPSGKPPTHAELMRSSTDFIHWSDPWVLNIGATWGKMGGFIDTQNDPSIPPIQSGGTAYRYVSMIEEGRIDLSTNLHQWIKAGTANLKGAPDTWCTSHECSGDIFVDADKNIRFESQIGVNPEPGHHGGAVVGNPLCTIGEGVLSGSDPTHVLWRSDLPWLTDWYGDAPTGAPEDFTATNGSVFPGQTIVKDGWLWHFSGGNNHCVLLTQCRYGPQLECRDLRAVVNTTGLATVHVTVRNVGSLAGSGTVTLLIDGKPVGEKQPRMERDSEESIDWQVPVPPGLHTLSVDDLALTVLR